MGQTVSQCASKVIRESVPMPEEGRGLTGLGKERAELPVPIELGIKPHKLVVDRKVEKKSC